MAREWTLRDAGDDDAQWLADLKAVTMRSDLERLGLWDESWAKRRFLETYVPANTWIVVLDGADLGSIAVRQEPDCQWIEHFYLDPSVQGRGIGGQVLADALRRRGDHRPFRLAIDRGSRVQRLYERLGFRHIGTDANGVDEIFEHPSARDRADILHERLAGGRARSASVAEDGSAVF